MKNYLSLFVILFFQIGTLAAQEKTQLVLGITFPAKVDTFNYDRVRIAGYTTPGSKVTINDKSVKVFSHGAFASRVPLVEGPNIINIQANKGGEIVIENLDIFRPLQTSEIPTFRTLIYSQSLEPSTDIWLLPGDYLNVQFQANPNGRAIFSIDQLSKKTSMTELPESTAHGKKGVYNGIIKIPNSIPNKALNVKFEFVGQNGKKVSAEAPGKIFILPDRIPIIGMTKGPGYMFSSASFYSPLSRLPDSVRIHVIGKEKDRYKINLGFPNFAFVDADNIKILPLGTPLPIAKVSAPTIQSDKDWCTLSMWTNFPVPYKTIVNPKQQTIELLLYGANKSSNWTTIPNYETGIKSFNITANKSNELSIIVNMDQKYHWGHKVEYKDGQLLFSIRKAPNISSNPLAGIPIAIDAGHGGENEGTKSPIGLLEKDVNLRWAFLLKRMLQESGARVIMVRTFDEDVSLEERLQRAIDQNALLFLSLHNNSTTPNGNPMAAKGTSTYYTLEQNRELAWTLFSHLTKLGLAPYGRVKNSYYLTNASEMLIVLLEGLFMSNPVEEKLLLDDVFLTKMASAVQSGIKDFLSNRMLTE